MMMAQPSDEPVMVPVSVIGSQFMAPYPLEVIVDTNSKGNLVITDTNHKIMLKVKPSDTTFHHQRLLLDADDRPIVMLRDKMMSEHKRWKVFRGDSKANSDMIFSTKTAFSIQSKTNVHVFLATNTRKKGGCDFKIKGSWSKRNCMIYMGDSSVIIARMHTMQPLENVKFIKDKFMLEVYPTVDYAFVVALIAIVDAMQSSKTTDNVVAGVIDGVIGAALGGVGS